MHTTEAILAGGRVFRGGGVRAVRSGVPLAAVLLAGIFLWGCSSKEEPEEAPTVAVQVGGAMDQTIQRKVEADAILYPLDQAALTAKVSAPVSKFYVERGSQVHAGQLLAELENKDLSGAVTENQGGYDQAQAEYQAAIQKAEQDLKLAKDVLDSEQKQYDSRVNLYKEGAIAAKDVDDAKVSLTQAQNEYQTAQKQLDLKAAEGQLMAAKGRTESAAAELGYTKIVSPIDGVVTDLPFYAGETPPTGSPILTVMNLSSVIARAHIGQDEAANLKAGDVASVTVAGQSPVKGKVTLVSPALDPNSTTVEVWVQAPNPGGKMRPGTSARVSMVAQSVPHAIVIPVAALLTDTDGTTRVIVLDSDNMPHKQKVQVGIRDGDAVQITSGLKGGERVVTVGAFELDNEDDPVLAKTKIQVQAPKVPDEDDDDE